MTTISPNYSTPAAYAVAASLASPNYDLTGTVYNSTVTKPQDVIFEYAATVAATPTGNKQIVLFVQGSLDGTTWSPLPTSTTDATHDTSMRLLGSIATNAAELVRDRFNVSGAFGGVLPAYWRVVVKNDCGVALSTCSARTQEISLSVA